MTLLDWLIFIALVICGILGFLFGAKRRVTRKLGWFGGLVIAILFYSMLTNLILSKTPLGVDGANRYATLLLEKADSNTASILNGSFAELHASPGADASMATGLSALGVPRFFASYFISKIYFTSGTVAQALGSGITAGIAYPVTFLILYVLSSVVLVLILRFLLGGLTDGKVTLLDRIAGVFLRILEVSIPIFVLMVILASVSAAVPAVDSWFKEQVHFGEGSVSISGVYYRLAWQFVNAFKLLS